MKIAEYHSHLNGLEFILIHKAKLWEEIQASIKQVDARRLAIRTDHSQTYSLESIRHHTRASLDSRGWKSRRAYYWIAKNVKLNQKTIDLPPELQKQRIMSAGDDGATRSFTTHLVKDRVGIGMQFGKYFAVTYDLFVKHLAFYVGDVIDVGVEIVPMKSFAASIVTESGKRARQMSTGVPWYEKELYNLIREGRGVPAVPLVIVGIAP
jgi:hypothetical protein